VANNDQWLLLTSIVLSSLTAVYQLLVAESVTGVEAPIGIRGTVADRRVHFNGGGGGPEECRPQSVWHVPGKNRDGKTLQRPCRQRQRRVCPRPVNGWALVSEANAACVIRRIVDGNDVIYFLWDDRLIVITILYR
jgi:hypothetical protein